MNTPGVALVRSPVGVPVGTPVNPTACFLGDGFVGFNAFFFLGLQFSGFQSLSSGFSF